MMETDFSWSIPTRAKKVEAYIQASQQKSDVERQENKERTGVFTGSYVINWSMVKITDGVAGLCLVAMDLAQSWRCQSTHERDFAFAEKFDLLIIQVADKPAA